MQKAYEAELLLNQLIQRFVVESKSGAKKAIDLNVLNTCKQLKEQFHMLCKQIKRCLIQQVADNFVDINQPLKKLSDLILNQNTKTGKLSAYMTILFIV